jgi:hypothetical protein
MLNEHAILGSIRVVGSLLALHCWLREGRFDFNQYNRPALRDVLIFLDEMLIRRLDLPRPLLVAAWKCVVGSDGSSKLDVGLIEPKNEENLGKCAIRRQPLSLLRGSAVSAGLALVCTSDCFRVIIL